MFKYVKDNLRQERYISQITFDISTYGEIKETLKFGSLKTELEAISEVEIYLSKAIDKTYFDIIKNDIPDIRLTFEKFIERNNKYRGDVLKNNNVILEIFNDNESKSSVYIHCQ